jgi:hypothetical protein
MFVPIYYVTFPIALMRAHRTAVIPHSNRWMDVFLTVKALSNGTIEDVNRRRKGLGYQ